MYIDAARRADLSRMHSEMHDSSRPMNERKRAYRIYSKIQLQLKDPVLSKLRERLTKAYFAEDKYETWKITNQIKDYLGEEILEEGTM